MSVEIKITGYSELAVNTLQKRIDEIAGTITELLDKQESFVTCTHEDIIYRGEDSYCNSCGANLLEVFETVNAERLAKKE